MLFNSFSFGIFLPVVFILYWMIPKKYQWAIILFSSYYFYMSWNVQYVFLIFFTTLVSYISAILVEREGKVERKKMYLFIATTASLGVLFFFKYFNFFSVSIAEFANIFSDSYSPIMIDVILPVGISFYTFQTLAYVIDVYKGEINAELHFGKYAAFISFFPQLVAGPIERTSNLLPQIKKENEFLYEQASYGLKLMVWGFLKKIVIADTLAIYVDMVYNDLYKYTGCALIIATLFFTIQIYCDFSGYSDIAIGCAKLFGIELMHNFRSPYFSSSVKEFWSRWHISLSTWFRDYVYIQMGGNRVSSWRHRFNLIVTFLISGLWHGADWTYVIWGGIHGLAQVVENVLMKSKTESKKGIKSCKVVLIFGFTAFAWIFFRAQDISGAIYVITHAFLGISNPVQYFKDGYDAINMQLSTAVICMGLIGLLCLYDSLSLKYDVIQQISRWRAIWRWMLYFLIVLLIMFCAPIGNEGTFIYFQF